MASGKRVKGLTIEINGDVTGLDQALKKTNSALNSTQRELNDVNKLLKLDPKNTELLTQKQKLLSESIANTKNKLETLKTAQEQALKQLENKEIGQKQYDALQREIAETEQELKKFETAADGVESELKEMANEADNAADKTDELDISLGSMVKNAAVNLAVDAMRAIGDKAIEAAKYVVDVGSTFEASMDKVAATSGASSSEIAKLTEKAKKMGATTKFSASESADAFNFMAMAGWKTEEMLQGIDGIMALAAASGADLATTSDIVTDALTAFGESAEESGRLADIMAAASSNANTNVEMMGETFKYAAPVAGALGISMEDTAVAVGLMANSGIKASQAGTALRTGLSNLAKPTKQMKEWMDKYNIALVENEDGSVNLRDTMIQLREKMGNLSETEQAAAASAIFGKNAMSGWMAVINASDDDFNQLVDAIDNSNGAAQGMADTMQNNLSGAMTIFKSALEGLGIELYGKAVKPLTGAVEFATGVINGLTNILKDSRSENELVIDQIKNANKELTASVNNASTIQAGAKATAGQIDVLVQALLNLNKQENLDETQKKRLKAIYDDLVELVPEMAGYYNEETGKIDLTTEAVRKLTKARKDEIIEQGRLKALSDVYEKMGAAQAELQKATANLKGMQKQRKMWEDLRDKIGEAQSALNNTFQDMNKGPDLSALDGLKNELLNIAQAALNSGAITKDTYDEIAGMFDDNWSESELAAAYEKLQRNVEETDIDIKNAEESMGNLQREYDNAEQTVKNLEESIDSHTKATREEIGVVDDSANSVSAMTDEKMKLKKAIGESADATKTNTDAVKEETKGIDLNKEAHEELRREVVETNKAKHEEAVANRQTKEDIDEAIKSVHAQADAEKTLRDATQQARDDMTKAFDDIQKSVESAFNLNPFDQWQQDLKKGWEAFDGAMLSQIEGMKNYQTNMDLVREHLSGKAPDFVKFLEDMGQSGAQFVDDLARGIREGGEASISSIDYTVGLWRENHSLEDAIEDSFARSKLAAELGLAGLTDSDVLAWEDLGHAFDEGKSVIEAKGGELSQTTEEAFWGAIDAAKAAGMQVPKGAAEAIRNSDDPEQAMIEWTGILNASLRARGEELLIHAQELGIQIPSGIASVLQDEKATAEQIYGAMDSLIAIIKTKDPDFEAAGTEAGEAAGSATAAGITNKEEDVTGAADEVVEAAKNSASTSSEVFNIVGHTAMEALKGGIREKSQEVSGALTALLTIVKNNGTNHGNQIFPGIGSDIDAHIVSGISQNAGTVTGALNSIMDSMNTDAAAQCNSMRATFNNMIADVSNAINNTHLSFPSIQIPHVRWTWEWLGYADGGGTYYPNFYVDWYAKAMRDGMILDNPTIFGMMNGKLLGAGEAGSETVVGTDSLMNMIKSAVAETNNVNLGGVTMNITAPEGMNVKQLAKQIEIELSQNIIRRQASF